jgi:hypothetical protein
MLLLLSSCQTTQPACVSLCEILVRDCEYDAYPSLQSCEQGCAYDEENGADSAKLLACVEDADCNTFAVVECQHRFGVED